MIVPVKRINLVLLPEEKNAVFLALQKEELFMIKGFNVENHSLFNSDQLVKTKKVIKILEAENKKKNPFETISVDYQTIDNIQHNEFKVIDEVIDIENKKADFKDKIQRLNDQISTFIPFTFLSISQEKLSENELISFKAYKIALEKKKFIANALLNLGLEHEMGEFDKAVYLVVAMIEEVSQDLAIALQAVDAEEVQLPSSALKYSDAIEVNKKKVEDFTAEMGKLDEHIKGLVKDLPQIKTYYDKEVNRLVREHVPFKQSNHFIVLEGYVREDQMSKLEQVLASHATTYEIESVNDTKETLPTALKNNKFVKPFETITDSFSVPNNKEIDPNPIMSVWYWIFFGIMIADIGYGLVLLVGSILFIKLKKPRGNFKKLLQVFMYSSISAILFGLVTGSVFGIGFREIIPSLPDIFISPQDDPLTVLIASLVLGALHIVTALVLKAILMFKEGDVLGALAEAVSWILILLAGLVFVADMSSIIWPSNVIISYITLGLIGLGVVFIVFLSGRGSKNAFGWILKGFGGIYGATSYLSDLLSYSRLLALALSGGVIAFTMNLLAGMIAPALYGVGIIFAILIIIVGHVFNFAMSLLSAYVHGGRLQYLEFYGKFFQGGGYAFKPLGYHLDYINEIKEN